MRSEDAVRPRRLPGSTRRRGAVALLVAATCLSAIACPVATPTSAGPRPSGQQRRVVTRDAEDARTVGSSEKPPIVSPEITTSRQGQVPAADEARRLRVPPVARTENGHEASSTPRVGRDTHVGLGQFGCMEQGGEDAGGTIGAGA